MRASRTPSTLSRKVQRTARAGLTRYAELLLKQVLRQTAPSEPWVEAQIKSSVDVTSDGVPIVYRYHDTRAFPPGGPATRMVRCPKCGVFTPPNTMEHGACLDHARHQGWTPSPSAVAIRRLQMLNLRIESTELPPEDIASLRREIDEFNNRKNVRKNRKSNVCR